MADLVRVRLFLHQQALRHEVVDNALTSLERGQAVVRQPRHIHAAVLVHAVDDFQPVTLTDLVVHRVVAGRDLERAGAEVFLHRIVGDDRELASDERQHRGLAHQLPVSVVVRVDGDPRVGEHRFGPHRGYDHVAVILDRISDEVESVLVLLPFDLEIRDRRSVVRAPVHDARRAVDPTPVVKSDERRHHRADVFRVHREPQPAPVHRRPQQTKLVDDRGAHLLVPGLNSGGKTVAAQLLFGRTLAGELLLDHVLGRDRRVVVAGQEQNLLPIHAPEARNQVIDRGLQRVAHVELARDVGRRKAHGELRLVAVWVRDEQCVGLPARVPAGLDGLRIERFRHLALRLVFFCHGACFIALRVSVTPA